LAYCKYQKKKVPLGLAVSMCSPKEDTMKHAFTTKRAFLLLSALLLCFFAPRSFAQEQPTIRFVRNPDAAPDFKLTDLDGKPFNIAASHGKVVLLNFWATWCGPCRAEIPDLIDLQNKYKDRLQILSLIVDDDDDEAIKKFAQDSGINYPVAMASDEIRLKYGGIAALPTSFLLDTEGRIVQKHEGLRNPVLYEVEIRSLLGLSIGNVKVETFEDTGQIFLKNADRASELPGVDMSKLTPEQKVAALHKFNAETCNCGCQFTLAQCRIYDHNCQVSKERTSKIIAAIRHPAPAKPEPGEATPAAQTAAAPEKPRN
jgi:thiol-disulfide isomerase/thioredoxin